MIHFMSHPAQSANQNHRSMFGGSRSTGGTPGTSGITPNAWLPKAIDIFEFNHIRDAAITAGHSITLDLHDGTTAVASLTMVPGDGTQKISTFSATLSAAASAAVSECHLIAHTQSGVTANALGTSALVYQDQAENDVSYFNAGDGTSNFSVGATPEFIAVHGGGTTGATVENTAQVVIPAAGTLKNLAVRYTTDTTNSYTLDIMVNGVSQAAISLAIASAGAIVINNSLSVALDAGDLLTFRFTRTAGAGTLLQAVVVFGVKAT